MENNPRVRIQLENNNCKIYPYDNNNQQSQIFQNTPAKQANSNSVSLTISDESDANEGPTFQNDLEISYKSIFYSEKKPLKSSEPATNQEISNNTKKLKYSGNVTKSTAATPSLDNNEKENSQKQITPFKPVTITASNNNQDPSMKRSQSTLFSFNLGKIKIKKNSSEQKQHKKYIGYSKKNLIKKLAEKKFERNIELDDSQLKINSLKKKSISHREISTNKLTKGKIHTKSTSNLLRHNSYSSCLILKKSRVKHSPSASMLENKSSHVNRSQSSSRKKKTLSFCVNQLLTPKSISELKSDSRNSILKQTLIQGLKKSSSRTRLGDPSMTQRQFEKKIYLQTPGSQENQKFSVPYLNKNTNTSPSPAIGTQKAPEAKQTQGLNHKKVVYTINNFSKYVKKTKNSNTTSTNSLANTLKPRNSSGMNKKKTGGTLKKSSSKTRLQNLFSGSLY